MKKIIILDGPDGYWHDLRSEPYLFSRRVQGGGSIMICAIFYAKGKRSFVFTKTNMNCFDYQDILGNKFVPPKD